MQTTTMRSKSLIAGLMLVILLGALDSTIVAVALPEISGQLHGFEWLAWVVSGYLVASTVVTPIYGKLGDLYGRRAMLSVAITVFLCASVLCGLAQSMVMLVAARILQGLGGGGLISVAQAAIADEVPLRERGRYQGYISGMYALASVAGPVTGGYLTHYLSWRWIFWINLPLGLLALAVCRRVLHRVTVRTQRPRIDYVGALTLSAGLTTLLIALTRIGQGYDWRAPDTLALFAAAAVLLSVCLWHERRAPEPILPLHLFKRRIVVLGCAILFIAFFELMSLSVLLPLQWQMVLALPADAAALRLIALSLSVPAGAYLGGTLMARSGHYRRIQIGGALAVTLGVWVLAQIDPALAHGQMLCMIAIGAGVGAQFPTTLVAVQNAVPREHLGIVTALQAFFRSLGGAVGLAVLSALWMHTLRNALPASGVGPSQPLADWVVHGLLSGQGLDQPLIVRAFERVFDISAGVAAIAVVLTAMIPEARLDERRPGP